LQRKRKKRPLPICSTTAAALNHVTVRNATASILPVEYQQETIISAEMKLHAIYKAGDDYNALHSTLCGPDGGYLRGLLLCNEKSGGLLCNEKSGGRTATVHELWNGRAKDDPLNNSLSFAGAIENGLLIPKQAVVGETTGTTATRGLLPLLLGQFSDCLCQFQHHEQIRFFRAGKLNEGLVLALNGLVYSKLHFIAQIDQTDHLVNSSSMIGMIEFLLKQSNDNLVCTIKAAQDAFSSMHLGKKSEDTHGFDLRKQTFKYFDMSFGPEQQSCSLRQSCYAAMKQLGYCNKSMTAVGYNNTWLPRVATYTVKDPRKDLILPFKVSVVHDFALKSFHDEVIQRMNELVYLVGLGGKRNAWLRSASVSSPPAPFTVGQLIYGGLPAANIEQKLLDIANVICEGQKRYVKSQLGHGFLVTFAANQLLTVVGSLHDALFSRHCDYSPRLCTDIGHCCHKAEPHGHYLPQRHELQVITFVLCNSPLQHSTELVYRTKEGMVLCRVPLSNCCLHLQGPTSQMGSVTHEVARKTDNGNEIGDEVVYRMLVTCRYVVDPIVDKSLFYAQLKKEVGYLPDPTKDYHCNYNQSRVFDRMMTDEFSAIVNNPTAIVTLRSQQRMIPNKGRSRDIATPLLSKVYLLLRENSDTFVNIDQAQYENIDNYCFNQKCEFEGSAYHMLTSYDAIRFFFEQKILIQTQQNGQAKLIEILP
jgi:hypothetical protein